jgi:hypothetical protein
VLAALVHGVVSGLSPHLLPALMLFLSVGLTGLFLTGTCSASTCSSSWPRRRLPAVTAVLAGALASIGAYGLLRFEAGLRW